MGVSKIKSFLKIYVIYFADVHEKLN